METREGGRGRGDVVRRMAGPILRVAEILAAAALIVFSVLSWKRQRRITRVLLVTLAGGLCLHVWETAIWALGVLLVFTAVAVTVLGLLNWVRTRRFAVVLVMLVVIGAVTAIGRGGETGSWYYPGIVINLGLAMLLIRLWPRWRLLRRPTPAPPPRTPEARGLLSPRPWPQTRSRGMALVAVLIGFVVVLAVAAAGASCLIGAAQASSAAQRSLVATALLEGELARVRAGDLPLARLPGDVPSRAERLLPDPQTSTAVRPAGEAGLYRVDLEVSWREPGRAVHRTSLSGLVYSNE